MSKLEIARLVGTASGLITVVSFIPQTWSAWRHKRTGDLSYGTFGLLALQGAGWLTYGILLGQSPIIMTNVCVLVLSAMIVVAKWRNAAR